MRYFLSRSSRWDEGSSASVSAFQYFKHNDSVTVLEHCSGTRVHFLLPLYFTSERCSEGGIKELLKELERAFPTGGLYDEIPSKEQVRQEDRESNQRAAEGASKLAHTAKYALLNCSADTRIL